jgi:hypothetical protein
VAYTASIALVVEGIKDVQKLTQQIEDATKGVEKFNNYAKEAFGGNYVRSINNLSAALRDANAALDAAALNGFRAADAAKAYLAANREMIRGLQDRKELLRQVAAEETAAVAAASGMKFTFGGPKALPAAGQTAFKGEVVGGMGGGARAAISSYETLVNLSGRLAARSQDSADAALRFAQNVRTSATEAQKLPEIFGIVSKTLGTVSKSATAAGIGDARTANANKNNRLESVLLGAGFPLLFGGGAGEVAGGVLGSFFGKGFGGQIFLSAIGGQLDDFIAKTGELGRALNPATADVGALVKALGASGTATSKYITQLEELGKKQEALAIATKELENLVGQRGVAALKEFGQDSANLGNEFTKAMTQMQASLAEVVNQIGIITALTESLQKANLLRQALQSQDPRQQELLRQREVASRGMLFGGSPAAQAEIDAKLIENQRTINAEKEKQYQAQLKILDKEQKLKEELDKIKDQYTNIASSVEKRAQAEQNAIDRGLSISNARYEAEAALNSLEQTRLERAYKMAQTEQQRVDIAVALFSNAVKAAQIEYQQQLESIAAEERKLQVKLQEYELGAKLIEQKRQELLLGNNSIQNDELRKTRANEINTQADKALAVNKEVISAVNQQLETQKQISQYQIETAKYQYEGKVAAAQTALEQRLVSNEIGMSAEAASNLANRLGAGASNAYQLAGGLGSAAQQAAGLAVELARVENVRAQNVTAQTGYAAQYQYSNGMTGSAYIKAHYAAGGYVTRPTAAMVGEGGQPEYVVPASKAKNFSMNYLAGARGASAISNSGFGGSDSGSPVTVSIQTGPVTQMNGVNYVTTQQMTRAVQEGIDQTMRMISRDTSIRRSMGVR